MLRNLHVVFATPCQFSCQAVSVLCLSISLQFSKPLQPEEHDYLQQYHPLRRLNAQNCLPKLVWPVYGPLPTGTNALGCISGKRNRTSHKPGRNAGAHAVVEWPRCCCPLKLARVTVLGGIMTHVSHAPKEVMSVQPSGTAMSTILLRSPLGQKCSRWVILYRIALCDST